MNAPKRIKLSLVSRWISQRTGRPGPSYRRIWTAAVNGEIPAELGPDGRWSVREEDASAIDAAFGIPAKDVTSAVAA